MAGGLMQLVAYGAQDIYLTGNPQITFFKVVYRRHTNFAMEAIEQTFTGTADWGKRISCIVARSGDLIHRTYLQTRLPELTVQIYDSNPNTNCSIQLNSYQTSLGINNLEFHWVNWIGHKLIEYVEVEIGGQRIDRHYGEWLHLWNELTQTASQERGYARCVGNITRLVTTPIPTPGNQLVIPATTLYIPLQFWFCRNPGLALPLIALQYHEVKLNIQFESFNNCIVFNYVGPNDINPYPSVSQIQRPLGDSSLWIDYIYLDTDERRRFAQVAHEYLIDQVQFTGEETLTIAGNRIKLAFNHPVKELVWITQVQAAINAKQWTNFSNNVDLSFSSGAAMNYLGEGLTGDLNPGFGFNVDGFNEANGILTLGTTNLNPQQQFDNGLNPTQRGKLQINGQDRFAEREGDYFNYVQPLQHHTRSPALGINVYSFALKPEDHQPSGTCNFSRIDNATLFLQLNMSPYSPSSIPDDATISPSLPAKLRVYAVNYNVLRIMSGMGGLAYSN